jgi:hypothetical protein
MPTVLNFFVDKTRDNFQEQTLYMFLTLIDYKFLKYFTFFCVARAFFPDKHSHRQILD